MAMEVIWIRVFAPVVKTQIYSFALIIATYLGATFVGSLLYRRHLAKKTILSSPHLIAMLCGAAYLPVICNDPHIVRMDTSYFPHPMSVIILLASICPFCAALGYFTPRLIDEFGTGSPERAGRAYAINVFGCILGPIFASYILLRLISDRHALIVLGIPFFLLLFFTSRMMSIWHRWVLAMIAFALLGYSVFFARDFEDYAIRFQSAEVRRDYTASVLSFGKDREKLLCVNGIGMTALTPITKFMVHLPLAFHTHKPQSALIICFGMGTSYRSALSWNIKTTAVELVPSVKDAFGFYHKDAHRYLSDPNGHIVIDDGRRYLRRCREKFDIIVIDPPPPPEAAGSSLLYSQEFYALAKSRLKEDGILQAWVPGGENSVIQAAIRSLISVFPYVRCFGSVEHWGLHLLASMEPIERQPVQVLAARMPTNATSDLLEWADKTNVVSYLDNVISQELPVDELLNSNFDLRITDDSPYNEYFFLRRLRFTAEK